MWESVGGARSAPRPRSSAQRRRGSIIVARARLQHRQMASKVVIPTDSAAADSLLASTELRVVNFCASWAEPCTVCNAAFAELANEHSTLTFIQLDADAFPDQCERFNLESVPAFLFLNGGKLVDSVMGADVPDRIKSSSTRSPPRSRRPTDRRSTFDAPPPKRPNRRRRSMTASASQSPCMLFMKGSPDEPRCGFS